MRSVHARAARSNGTDDTERVAVAYAARGWPVLALHSVR
jgi:hypothetical protein